MLFSDNSDLYMEKIEDEKYYIVDGERIELKVRYEDIFFKG
jgi:hypothetical protein